MMTEHKRIKFIRPDPDEFYTKWHDEDDEKLKKCLAITDQSIREWEHKPYLRTAAQALATECIHLEAIIPFH